MTLQSPTDGSAPQPSAIRRRNAGRATANEAPRGWHRALLTALLDSLQEGVLACDAAGRPLVANRAVPGNHGGERPSASQARPPLLNLDGTPLPARRAPLTRALAGERVDPVDLLIKDEDGRARRYAVTAKPILDLHDRPFGAVEVLCDVTDQRRASALQRCQLVMAQALIDGADPRTVGRDVLGGIAEALGWPHAEMWLHTLAGDAMEPVATWTRAGYDTGLALPSRLRVGAGLPGLAWRQRQTAWLPNIHEAGTLFPSDEAAGSPLRTAVAVPVHRGEDVYGVLVLFSDIAEPPNGTLLGLLRGLTAELGQYLERRRAEDYALQLTRIKEAYIALVGHELRTPLTSIAAYTELLRDLGDELPADAHQLLEIIARNSDALRRLVDSLLDLAALDSGHVTMQLARVDLVDIVNQSVADLTPRADECRVRIEATLPESLDVEGDPVRLRQVVDAVLSNAVGYSHPCGTVALVVERVDATARITVTDTGIGIPADEVDRVFNRFHRSSRVRDLRLPGAGLGLATSRLIIEQHHGSISLQPADGGGTTIVVRLPVSRTSDPSS